MNCMRGPLEAEKYEFDLCTNTNRWGEWWRRRQKKRKKKRTSEEEKFECSHFWRQITLFSAETIATSNPVLFNLHLIYSTTAAKKRPEIHETITKYERLMKSDWTLNGLLILKYKVNLTYVLHAQKCISIYGHLDSGQHVSGYHRVLTQLRHPPPPPPACFAFYLHYCGGGKNLQGSLKA